MNTEKIISYGIGRRKQAIAQVILKLGNGTLTINNKSWIILTSNENRIFDRNPINRRFCISPA